MPCALINTEVRILRNAKRSCFNPPRSNAESITGRHRPRAGERKIPRTVSRSHMCRRSLSNHGCHTIEYRIGAISFGALTHRRPCCPSMCSAIHADTVSTRSVASSIRIAGRKYGRRTATPRQWRKDAGLNRHAVWRFHSEGLRHHRRGGQGRNRIQR